MDPIGARMMRVQEQTGKADHGDPEADTDPDVPAPSGRAIAAALAGMAAAWIAAGSTGLLAHPLRHALTWPALGLVVVAAWPGRPQSVKDRVILLATLVAALLMTALATPVGNVAAVALVLAILARANGGSGGRLLLITALATLLLALFLLASASIPTAWSLADASGRALGRVAGRISGRPLSVGATFGGVDFLVLMAALYAGWLASTARPRLARAIWAAVAILAGQLAYLVLLSYSTDLVALLPASPPPPETDLYVPPDWNWADAVRSLLPWNVPLLAGAIQLAVAGMMFRWASWQPPAEDAPKAAVASPGRQAVLEWGPPVLALLIPWMTTLSLGRSDLTGTKIVAYERGYLNWDKPQHDRYGQDSAGLYGMLPEFAASLGGRFVRSANLAAEDLDGADVLLVIHPDRPWPRETSDRVWDFVGRGGSLLLVAEPRIQEQDRASSFNKLLEPTGIRVRFNTTIAQTGHWQHACQALAHPATAGLDDRRNPFGLMIGSSIRAGWPARPILVGRWGWGEPGSDAMLTGRWRYDPGEPLGDLVLAAEQRFGRGTVVVLGDPQALSNEGTLHSYRFTGRLLGYLARHSGSPQAGWRQALGLLGIFFLLGLLACDPRPLRLAMVSVVLTLSLAASTATSYSASRVIPGSREDSAYRIAYIDASHLEASSGELWADDGIAGLALTLIRNGYLPLLLPEITSERLGPADLLISIGPAREFSETERRSVRNWVEAGGTFLCMAGAERSAAVAPLLEDFDFGVPPSPLPAGAEAREPKPLGFFSGSYLDTGQHRPKVFFYAGWPISHPSQGTEVLARDVNRMPVMAVGRAGNGTIILVGDTGFAMNKNLESVWGRPFFGRYDNAQFWRWLFSALAGGPEWIPLPPKTETLSGTGQAGTSETGPPGEDRAEPSAGEEGMP